ncbi:GerAB/ArcD/ProY family transporter [Alteribacillus bidgolensis]|uniref:GerAB/ArcD/ProY family transporter n=1 Tax=Alteribacillus bidgolensis TaxID=930129 RepID=UPI0020C849AE|nr:GerAB/ArcD/ProY family transporter [Alteribacillus bidgolensis]
MIAVTLSTIMVFGPIAGERAYSMFEVARTIELYEIIQRMESLIGYALIVASYMKAVISLYVLNITITHLFRSQDTNILIFPLALVCFLYSTLQISLGKPGG